MLEITLFITFALFTDILSDLLQLGKALREHAKEINIEYLDYDWSLNGK